MLTPSGPDIAKHFQPLPLATLPEHCRSANQMSPLLPAHRTTATLPIYSVLAVAAVVPPSQVEVRSGRVQAPANSPRSQPQHLRQTGHGDNGGQGRRYRGGQLW